MRGARNSIGNYYQVSNNGLQTVLSAATGAYSSLYEGTRKAKVKSHPRVLLRGTASAMEHIKYMPEACQKVENGWQTGCQDVKSRIATLFNCYTMSDVTFQVDLYSIPAHKFILASASPVFFKQLYEDEGGDAEPVSPLSLRAGDTDETWFGGLGRRHVHLDITDVPHVAFFEFLQFIYTDNVQITLDNVLPLIFLADTYKVAGLNDRCLAYIRSEVVPQRALRVVNILRLLMLKACVSCWRAGVEQNKALRHFRQLGLSERRARIQELDPHEGSSSHHGSSHHSRRTSAQSSNRRRSERSIRSSPTPRSSTTTAPVHESESTTMGVYNEGDAQSLAGDDGDFQDGATVMDMMRGIAHKLLKTQLAFHGVMTEGTITAFVEELDRRCWKCIREDTGIVISSSDMWQQDVRVLRRILRLESCSVPEICLFRAVHDWAQHACKQRGLAATAENQRQVLGPETLLLIRFPVMTVEQFQWEVVPTGLLDYEDVQQLLQAISQRDVPLGRFNGKPRSNPLLLKVVESTFHGGHDAGSTSLAQHDELMKSLYNVVPDDPIDAMLSAELLRSFLKDKVDGDGNNAGVTVAEADLALNRPSAAFAPLPSPRSARLPFIRSTTSSPVAGRQRQMTPNMQMVMGQRLDEEVSHGLLLRGGGRRSRPEDFSRLCQGLYVFRGRSLLELWLEAGEVMAKDHGPSDRLQALRRDRLDDPNLLETASPCIVRLRLGLPEGPPERGAPLGCFLARL